MAESNQSKQNREQKKFNELKKEEIKLSEEAIEFEKGLAEESRERSKFEKEILSYLQEQSISAQILQNLTSDKVDELREQTDLLKDARSFQAESVKDLKEK